MFVCLGNGECQLKIPLTNLETKECPESLLYPGIVTIVKQPFIFIHSFQEYYH